jgi:trk system potassium uptake protein TrkA
MELTPDYSIEEIVVPERMHGKSLGNLNLRAKYGISVIAIKKPGGCLIPGPGADSVFEPGDVAVVIGTRKGLKHLEEK